MKYYLLALLLMTGCSASLRTTTKQGTAYAPVNEVKGGEVTYSDQGYKFVREKRRQDAYKKMHDYCGGPYKITNEGSSESASAGVPSAVGMVYSKERTINIKFECVGK